jgi:hypothetical protein
MQRANQITKINMSTKTNKFGQKGLKKKELGEMA